MGLTPEQVRDVTFPRPPWFRRGYHEDSVDAFLDYVCAELMSLQVDYHDMERLSQENLALRQRLAELTGGAETRPALTLPAQRPPARRNGHRHYAPDSDHSRAERL